MDAGEEETARGIVLCFMLVSESRFLVDSAFVSHSAATQEPVHEPKREDNIV